MYMYMYMIRVCNYFIYVTIKMLLKKDWLCGVSFRILVLAQDFIKPEFKAEKLLDYTSYCNPTHHCRFVRIPADDK